MKLSPEKKVKVPFQEDELIRLVNEKRAVFNSMNRLFERVPEDAANLEIYKIYGELMRRIFLRIKALKGEE